jgi:anti-sigma B factor antagonist
MTAPAEPLARRFASWDGTAQSYLPNDERPQLAVRTVGRRIVVDVLNADALFDRGVILDLGSQLSRLIEDGHRRLLLNVSGVRYMSSDVLGTLAALYRRVAHDQGRIGLIGLDPFMRDIVRICSSDDAFDIYADENEALRASITEPGEGDSALPPL